MKIWDVKRGKCINTLQGHTSFVTTIVKFPFGDLISGAYGSEVLVWDPESLKPKKTLSLQFVAVWSAHGLCTLGEERLGVACEDKSIRIYSTADNYHSFISLKAHSDQVSQIVSFGVNALASGSLDGTIRVWNVLSGKTMTVLECGQEVTSFEIL